MLQSNSGLRALAASIEKPGRGSSIKLAPAESSSLIEAAACGFCNAMSDRAASTCFDVTSGRHRPFELVREASGPAPGAWHPLLLLTMTTRSAARSCASACHSPPSGCRWDGARTAVRVSIRRTSCLAIARKARAASSRGGSAVP